MGLQIAYREDESIGQFFRKTAALAFVPVHLVQLAWQNIKSGPHVHMGINEFNKYFEDTSLVGPFPPAL